MIILVTADTLLYIGTWKPENERHIGESNE